VIEEMGLCAEDASGKVTVLVTVPSVSVVVVNRVVVLVVVEVVVNGDLADDCGGFEIGVPTTRVLVKGAVESSVNGKSVLETGVCATGELGTDAVDESEELDASIGMRVTVIIVSTGALDDSGSTVSLGVF
jgi:myo-inositol catabolism protein IolC